MHEQLASCDSYVTSDCSSMITFILKLFIISRNELFSSRLSSLSLTSFLKLFFQEEEHNTKGRKTEREREKSMKYELRQAKTVPFIATAKRIFHYACLMLNENCRDFAQTARNRQIMKGICLLLGSRV